MSRLIFACLVLSVFVPHADAADSAVWQEQKGWATDFAEAGVTGTMLIHDEDANRYLVFDRERAETRFIPASTFKLFNALVALETGAVEDEFEVIRWDGTKRAFDAWNRDHSLASGMKYSVVWFYQEMARRAGAERMQHWLDEAGYGNRDIGGGIDQFWLTGDLRISAIEEVQFLHRLADGSLPFSARTQEAVRRIALLEDAPTYTLHGKTGWATDRVVDGKPAADLGWFVGWVERDGRRWFFALDIDMPDARTQAAQRVPLARTLLVRAGALPSSSKKHP